MILDALSTIRAASIILASSSPRRTEILNGILGLEAGIIPSTFPEDLDKSKFTPLEYVEENARQKALEVYHRLRRDGRTPSLVVGADTVVVRDTTILEKPKSVEAAKAMLQSLSGRAHEVATGVALVYAPDGDADEPHVVAFVETTSVDFAQLSSSLIDACEPGGRLEYIFGRLRLRARTLAMCWLQRRPRATLPLISTCTPLTDERRALHRRVDRRRER